MNLESLRAEGDTQKKRFEALRRISEEANPASHVRISSHAMPDHATFFTPGTMLPTPDLESSIPPEHPLEEDHLNIHFNPQSEPSLSYESITLSRPTPLQVDHTGTKVEQPSPWLPPLLFSDLPFPLTLSSPSAVPQTTLQSPPSPAVFAAAVTAAMIVDYAVTVPKRPRSPPSECSDDLYLADNDTDTQTLDTTDDNTTEASLDGSEDQSHPSQLPHQVNGSPRTVIAFLNSTPTTTPAVKIESLHTSQDFPSRQPLSTHPYSVGILQAQTIPDPRVPTMMGSLMEGEPVPHMPHHTDMPRNAILSRKRRAEAMERFRRKKAVRCYGRRVRYQIRKRIATTRPRVNGRFARRTDAGSQAAPKATNT